MMDREEERASGPSPEESCEIPTPALAACRGPAFRKPLNSCGGSGASAVSSKARRRHAQPVPVGVFERTLTPGEAFFVDSDVELG
jgi:hypothetical protein